MGSPPDDKDFRKAVAGVAPLAEPRRVVLRPDPPPPLPRQSERDERSALAESLAGPVSRSCASCAKACRAKCCASCAAATGWSKTAWIFTA